MDEADSVFVGQLLMDRGVFSHVKNEHKFKNEFLFYRYSRPLAGYNVFEVLSPIRHYRHMQLRWPPKLNLISFSFSPTHPFHPPFSSHHPIPSILFRKLVSTMQHFRCHPSICWPSVPWCAIAFTLRAR